MHERPAVPDFFVYGEPSRSLEVGFLHVETVMERKTLHFGRVEPHRHAGMGQITYWYRGSGIYRIEEEARAFAAPAISFVPSMVVHGFEVAADADAIVVSVSDDTLDRLVTEAGLAVGRPVFCAGQETHPAWSGLDRLLRLIHEDYRAQSANSGLVLTGLIGVVLALITRLGSVGVEPASPSLALAQALRRAIDRHYREDWTVARYVSALATTPHLLDKAARDILGAGVKDLLMERRLLEAKRLLKFTIRPVEDIGRDVGFADPAYFSRFFRRRTGESPAAWRRRQMQEAHATAPRDPPGRPAAP